MQEMFKFSDDESRQIAISWGVLSIAFAITFGGGLSSFQDGFARGLLISSVTVGVGFILHELGHKFVAQRFGHWAGYRSFPIGLVLAVVFSLMGFVFAAPGAVFILGAVSTRENGIISAVGPLINIVFALLFLAASFVFHNFAYSHPLAWDIMSQGFSINAWLAFFNLLPIPPLDGSKVMSWSFPIWLALIAIAGYLSF